LPAATAEHLATALADTGRPAVEEMPRGMTRVYLTEAHLAALRALPEGAPWHLDAQGRLWINGSDYPCLRPSEPARD